MKRPETVFVQRASGAIDSYVDLLDLDAALRWSRWGALSPEFHAKLLERNPQATTRVALRFRVSELGDLSQVPLEQRKQMVADTISQAAEPLEPWLRAHGFEESGRATYMPMLFGKLAVGDVLRIAWDDRLTAILEDEEQPARPLATYDPVAEHVIDATWNTCATCGAGNWGQGVRVGLIESCQWDALKPRYIWHDHAAFAQLTSVSYREPPSASQCTTDSQCVTADECTDVSCKNGYCVDNHASRVASVISASKAGASGAAKVRMYMYNLANPRTIAGYTDTFEYLLEQDVYTVNQSHSNGSSAVSDYYAYQFDMTSMKASGDVSSGTAACFANDLCIGGHQHGNGGSACFQSDSNAASTPDKEEPDVLAFSGELQDPGCAAAQDLVKVHGFASTSDWSGQEWSTSYSAASVTSMVAHVRNECTSWGSLIEPELMRALFRTAAWEDSPPGSYDTPSLSSDGVRGGGRIDADQVNWFCQPGGSGGVVEIYEGNLGDGTSMPPGTSSYTPGHAHGTSYRAPEVKAQSYNLAEDANFPRLWLLIAEEELQQGNRVRFTLSWDACADGSTAPAVGVDFDLFLYNRSNQKFIYGSQSVTDNNEGFDIRLGDGSVDESDGTYQIWVAYPQNDSTNCGGTAAFEFAVVGRWGGGTW